MDLTNPKRAERNSDGVVFYKVWNGRKKPKMPAFKDELTKQQIWSVVAYVQTLRKTAEAATIAQRHRNSRHQLADHVADGRDAESHQEHVAAARPHAAAGEEAARGADREVREHADRERHPDRGAVLHRAGTARSE